MLRKLMTSLVAWDPEVLSVHVVLLSGLSVPLAHAALLSVLSVPSAHVVLSSGLLVPLAYVALLSVLSVPWVHAARSSILSVPLVHVALSSVLSAVPSVHADLSSVHVGLLARREGLLDGTRLGNEGRWVRWDGRSVVDVALSGLSVHEVVATLDVEV